MTEGRCMHRVVILSSSECLIIGGWSKPGTTLNSVLLMKNFRLYEHSEMHVGRQNAGVAGSITKVFVAGGYDGKEFLNSIEILDLNTRVWTMFDMSMPTPLSGFGLDYDDNRLIIVGGMAGENNVDGC